jgi:regulator of protease activity HflC (stomatin/prohibitin superfamily)
MERNIQQVGIINWFVLLAAAVCGAILARYANSAAGLVGVVFLVIGFLVAVVSYFQMRLEERERLEKLEFDELKKARGATTLFTEAGADTFPAQRSREQFEKFLVPAFTVILFLLQSGAAWWFWKWLDQAPPPLADRATITMALYALFAVILFLLGKYSSGLARLDGQRLLRPSAGYMMLGSLICFIVAVTEGAIYFGFSPADLQVARGFCVVLGLASIETLVGLVFEIYRPRLKGQDARLLYESRFIGLLGQPSGLITTAAHALDYQFGFKVSETWFYKFLEKALAWILLLQLTALWGSTFFVIIEPTEQGLLERFGQPVRARAVLEPGIHLKLPWPIDTVYRYQAKGIQGFLVGVVPDPALEQERTVLWTRPHYKEELNMLVASREQVARTDAPGTEKAVPANLLTASIPFQFRITNLVQWAYGHANAAQLLEELANREVSRYFVTVDMEEIMSSGRLSAGEAIRQRVQQRANELKLGVEIVFVGLQDVHPPVGNKTVQVAAAFEAVAGALQQKETNILAALAYQARKIPAAYAEAAETLGKARSDATLKVEVASAEADQFGNQMAAYRASPSVYTQRSYLETLARALAPVRKYVLGVTNTQDIIILNLEDKIRPDLQSGVALPPDAVKPPETKK